MLVISALVLLVYRYRYKPDPALEIERKRIERVEKSSVPAFNNKGVVSQNIIILFNRRNSDKPTKKTVLNCILAFEIDSSHIENTHF